MKFPFGTGWRGIFPLECDGISQPLWLEDPRSPKFPSDPEFQRLRAGPGTTGIFLGLGEDPWDPWKTQELPWLEVGLIQGDPWLDPRLPNSSGYPAGRSISWNSEGTAPVENLDGRSRNIRATRIPREKPGSICGISRVWQEWDSVRAELKGFLGSGRDWEPLENSSRAWSQVGAGKPSFIPEFLREFLDVDYKSSGFPARNAPPHPSLPDCSPPFPLAL